MQCIKNRENNGQIAFFVGIIIHIFIMVIEYGVWSVPLRGRFMHLAFALFCIKIMTTYYTKREWVAMILLGCVGALSYIGTGDEYMVSVMVMIFASKNIDMRFICKWIFISSLVFTIIIVGLSLCGIGGVPVEVRDYGRGGVEARWSLGFGHANNLHGTIWYMIALLAFLCFEKMDWRHYLLLTVGNLGLFYFTVSKSGFIATQIVIVAAVLLRYSKQLTNRKWIYLCGILGLAGVCIISIISVSIKWTEIPLLMFLDRIFTGRINLAYQHANINMWNLISSAGTFKDAVDNGFVTTFFYYGYLGGIVFIAFNLYLIYRAWEDKCGLLLAIIVSCIFYTFMESTYTMNTAYLLCNLSYIVAMIFMTKSRENASYIVKS